MRPADTQAEKSALEPDAADDLTKDQLEDMAVAFASAITTLDATIAEASVERSKYKKELRAVEGKLITINIRNRQTGGN